MKEINVETEEAMLALGAKLAKAVSSASMVIFLHGELGAGKTTFTRGMLRGLGYQGKVKSPTYTLVEPYELDQQALFHFDLYRLHDPNELEFIGIRDYFGMGAICIIEWPEKGDAHLPKPDLTCYIDFIPSGRIVRLEAHSASGEKVLQHLE